MPKRRSSRTWWVIPIIALAGALVYGGSLSYPFIFDDQVSIVTNTSIRDLWSPRVLTPDREVPTAGRPLVNLAHALNYAAGGLDPSGYRAVNLLFHLICGVLVYVVVRRTLTLRRAPGRLAGNAEAIAAMSALLWIVHPLNTEVVEYVTQRSESMVAAFYLLTIYASTRALGSGRAPWWSAAAVAACALGMACKESMVTAPVAVYLYDRTFAFGSWSGAMRARWRLYAALAATWLLLAALIWSGPRAYSAGFSTDVRPWTYLLNQAVLIPRYLRLAIWPTGLVVAYGPPLPLTLGAVLPSVIFMAALVAATAIALARWPAIGFVGAWVLLTLAPTSSIIPIATEAGAERRMYLPLIALAALFASVAHAFFKNSLSRRLIPLSADRLATIACITAAAGLAVLSNIRVREYASPLGLAETVLARWPTSFGHAIVGTQLAVAGRHDEAINQLRIAAPGYALAHYHLGGELFNRGRLDEALPELQAFVRLEPWRAEAVPARTMIGRALMAQKRWNEAADELQRVLTMAPRQSDVYTTALGLLADTAFGQERFDEAAALYRAFLGVRTRDVGATINLGVALAQSGRPREAADAFKRAIQLDPSNAMARRNLAIVFEENPALR
jgi:tetratricopeptide (TPR) repeat protein